MDAVEGVALTAAVAAGGLLDAAADLVHGLGSEFDDVEGVQDGGGVFEFVVQGGLVAGERVQGRDLDTGTEGCPAFLEPVLQDLPGPAGDQVEQPGVDAALRVAGQVHHPGQFLRAACAGGDVVPDVFVHPQARHTVEAGLLGRQAFQLWFHRPPQRLPRHPELAGQAQDGGVLAAELTDRPPDRPGRDRGPRGDQGGDLLREHAPRTVRVGAPPDALPPHEADRDTTCRDVA